MKANQTPLTSEFGFSSPGFSVDTGGNITVLGNADIAGSLSLDNISTSQLSIEQINSNTVLEIGSAEKIVLQINSISVGELTSQGLSISIADSSIADSSIADSSIADSSIADSSIENSIINETIIGNISPTHATFTSASIVNDPTNNNDAAKKSYVDLTSIAFSIALGS